MSSIQRKVTRSLIRSVIKSTKRGIIGGGGSGGVPTEIPVNTFAPRLSDVNYDIGDTVTSSNGTWTQYPSSYTKIAYLDNVSVGSNYTLQAGDGGKVLKIGVVASNIIGNSTESFTSNYTIPIRAANFAAPAAWWDFQKKSTLTRDGTTDPIKIISVTDRSGNARNLTTASSTNYATSEDITQFEKGRNCGYFVTDDYYTTNLKQLGSTKLFADAVDRFTVFCGFQIKTGGAGGIVIAKGGTTAGNRNFVIYDDAGTLKIIVRGTTNTPAGYNAGSFNVVGVKWDGLVCKCYVNGTESVLLVGVAVEETTQNIQVGARSNGGNFPIIEGRIGEVSVNDTAFSDANFTACGDGLKAYWNNRVPTARLLICGASNEGYSFTEQSGVLKTIGRIGKQWDSYILVDSDTQNGAFAATVKTNLDTKLATYSTESYPTYVMIGSAAGNNVTDSRPYHLATTPQKEAITTAYTDMISAIEAKGFIPIVADITFRHYAYTVDPTNDIDGSLPYTVNLIRPLVDTAFKYGNGEPMIQMYNRVASDPYPNLDADGVHLTRFVGQYIYQDEVANKIGGYVVNGVIQSQITYTLSPL